MSRFWVIAPYGTKERGDWEKVWRFDLDRGIISIGWTKLGDISSLSEKQLSELIDHAYVNESAISRKYRYRMLWNFYHSIKPGDVIIARKGVKKIAGIGTVVRAAYYESNKNPHAIGDVGTYSNHLDVRWEEEPQRRSIGLPLPVCQVHG
jgi:5-methylcytosine-specific restriction protein B